MATTITSWSEGLAKLTAPPRVTATKLPRGSTLGHPGDCAQQRRVLEATVALLEEDAPIPLLRLGEE